MEINDIGFFPVKLVIAGEEDMTEIHKRFTYESTGHFVLFKKYEKYFAETTPIVVDEYNDGKFCIIVMLRDDCHVPALVHESVHVALCLFDFIGEKSPGDEIMSYTAQYAFEKMFEFYKTKILNTTK